MFKTWTYGPWSFEYDLRCWALPLAITIIPGEGFSLCLLCFSVEYEA